MTYFNIIIHYKHIINTEIILTETGNSSFTIWVIVFCSDKTRGTSWPVLLVIYYLPVIFIAIFFSLYNYANVINIVTCLINRNIA